jgi:hypothetical protein
MGCCEYDNEIPESIRSGKYLYQLSDYQLLKHDRLCPMGLLT